MKDTLILRLPRIARDDGRYFYDSAGNVVGGHARVTYPMLPSLRLPKAE